MNALPFNEQFIPAILSGEKRHTIRRNRAKDWKVGDTIKFFAGWRTPKVRQFGEARVAKIEKITIEQRRSNHDLNDFVWFVKVNDDFLNFWQVVSLAKKDGFGGENLDDIFCNFMRFLYDHYGIYFEGQIIHWKDFKATEGGK